MLIIQTVIVAIHADILADRMHVARMRHQHKSCAIFGGNVTAVSYVNDPVLHEFRFGTAARTIR